MYYVRTRVCMYVFMYACMYVCMYVYLVPLRLLGSEINCESEVGYFNFSCIHTYIETNIKLKRTHVCMEYMYVCMYVWG